MSSGIEDVEGIIYEIEQDKKRQAVDQLYSAKEIRGLRLDRM